MPLTNALTGSRIASIQRPLPQCDIAGSGRIHMYCCRQLLNHASVPTRARRQPVVCRNHSAAVPTSYQCQMQHLSGSPAHRSAAADLELPTSTAAAYTHSQSQRVFARGMAIVAASSTTTAWTAANCIANLLAYRKVPQEQRQQLIVEAVAQLEQLQQRHPSLSSRQCCWIPVWCGNWQLRTAADESPNYKKHPQLQGPALAALAVDSSKDLSRDRRRFSGKVALIAFAVNEAGLPTGQSFGNPSALASCTDRYRSMVYRTACKVVDAWGDPDRSLQSVLQALPAVREQVPSPGASANAHSASSDTDSSIGSSSRAIRRSRRTSSWVAAAMPQPAALTDTDSCNETRNQMQAANGSNSNRSSEGAGAQVPQNPTLPFAELADRVETAVHEIEQVEAELGKDPCQWVMAVRTGNQSAKNLSDKCTVAYQKALRWSAEQLALDVTERAAMGRDQVRAQLQPDVEAATQVLESSKVLGD